jgi:hypothetical protein
MIATACDLPFRARSAGARAAVLCSIAVALAPIVGSVALPTAAAARESGVQLSPDGRRLLVSKDVEGDTGTERWAITRDLDDDTITGNVFRAAGGAPSFVFCLPVAQEADEVSLDCLGAGPCSQSPCSSTEWIALGTVRVPAAFLEPPGPDVSELPADDPLRRSPEAVVIDGRTVVLEVDELRRDYLTARNPLMVRIRLLTEESSPFPAGVAIDRLWVINDTLVWQSSPVADPATRDDPPPWAIEAYFTGGPQWGPTLSDPTTPLVTPVVRLRRGSEAWLLRGSASPIDITV